MIPLPQTPACWLGLEWPGHGVSGIFSVSQAAGKLGESSCGFHRLAGRTEWGHIHEAFCPVPMGSARGNQKVGSAPGPAIPCLIHPSVLNKTFRMLPDCSSFFFHLPYRVPTLYPECVARRPLNALTLSLQTLVFYLLRSETCISFPSLSPALSCLDLTALPPSEVWVRVTSIIY